MIVVFGSINIDIVVPVAALPRPGETVLGPGYRLVPGGKGANQALAAARAGLPSPERSPGFAQAGASVRMVGRVGRDPFAALALAELVAARVDLSAVERDDERPTGCALIPVDRDGQNLIVVAAGANGGAAQRQVADALLGPETLLLLQMEVPADENWTLIARARARGARVLLNAAPAAAIPRAVLAALDWLVVNESEAVAVAGGLGLPAASADSAAAAIAAAAGVTTIVTLGSAGAAAFPGKSGQGAWRIGALPIVPVDTTGAGDAFVGALAAALDAGAELPAALHRAGVAGGLACLTVGAQPSLPDKAAIDRRLADLPPPRRA